MPEKTDSPTCVHPVTICADGSCLGNPGPGGWGAVLTASGTSKELSGGYKLTTNNRMELLAVIRALEALSTPCQVEILTDSRYLRDGVEKGWLKGWKKNGWKTADKKPVKNQDLWMALDAQLARHKTRFTWVKGHAGHAGNERCDTLAKAAAMGRGLPVDEGYKS